jgi:hypothetical protein
MATSLDTLTAAKESLEGKLAAIAADTSLGPNVSIDGVSIDRVGYVAMLTKQLQEINSLIAHSEGPVHLVTQAVPG